MDAVNAVVRTVNRSIDSVVEYFKQNAIAVGCLLAAVYVYKNYVANSAASGKGYRLSADGSNSTASASRSVPSDPRNDEFRAARLRQQEIADQRAKEAAQLRKQKEAEERKRKNGVVKQKKKDTDKVGTSSGYNPMQPWSSGTGGYRAPRRTVRRG